MSGNLPRILMIDDLFGRPHSSRRPNIDRVDLCARLGLIDVSPDLPTGWTNEKLEEPIAEVVFCSGQVVVSGEVINDLESVVEAVRQGWQTAPRWALVLVDLHFKTGPLDANGEPAGLDEMDLDPKKYFGLTVLQRLQREFAQLPTIVFSAMEREKVAFDYTNYGAEGFLPRSATRSDLHNLLNEHGLLEDTRKSNQIIGRSFSLLLALRAARKAAKLGGNVLVAGEPGTGKELFARYLHAHSPFADGPYEPFFPQGIAESLFEGELFGYESHVFTGQGGHSRRGAAERADGGTLFIDEFGDIPLNLQPKFNRLLEGDTREVKRMGANSRRKLRLQIVLATNRDLHKLMDAGDFRGDLKNRIPARVDLPPLRERTEDIPLLVETFVKRATRELRANRRAVTPAALDMLCNAPWPGNVRELWNTLQRAVANHLTVEFLQPHHLEIERSHDRISVPAPVSVPEGASNLDPDETVEPAPASPSTTPESARSLSLVELVAALEAFQAPADYAGLQGMLPKLRRAFAICLARYLKAALLVNTKHSPQSPDGEVNYTGAIKCMTGLKDLKTGKANDEIKRLLQVDPDLREQILSQDPILARAWESAVKARKGPSNRQNGSAG